MTELLAVLGFAVGLAAVAYFVTTGRVRRLARRRLAESVEVAEEEASERAEEERPQVFVRRHYVIPWLVAVVAGLVLYFCFGFWNSSLAKSARAAHA